VISRANSAALDRAGGGASRRRRKTSPRWISWEPTEIVKWPRLRCVLRRSGRMSCTKMRWWIARQGSWSSGRHIAIAASVAHAQPPLTRPEPHSWGRPEELQDAPPWTIIAQSRFTKGGHCFLECLLMPSACSLHARPLQPGELDNLPPACVLRLGGAK
jgi:hypothetical protein